MEWPVLAINYSRVPFGRTRWDIMRNVKVFRKFEVTWKVDVMLHTVVDINKRRYFNMEAKVECQKTVAKCNAAMFEFDSSLIFNWLDICIVPHCKEYTVN